MPWLQHLDLRSHFLHLTSTLDKDICPLHRMQGLITRARARQLDLHVCSNLVNYFSELTLGSMHVLLIRNNGEDQQGLGEGQGVKEDELGRSHQGVHA
jgi:hypothetical protein